MEFTHLPVLLNEVLENLVTEKDGVYLDGTLGLGGHSGEILKLLSPNGRLIGMDLDANACEMALKKLGGFKNFTVLNRSYADAPTAIKELGIESLSGFLLDLGLSSYQLDDAQRGFSFMREGPLDMRFNVAQKISACDLVNSLDEKELADIFYNYADEYKSRPIARAIVRAREKEIIKDTQSLALIIEKAVGRKGRTHPATKVFQALRIAVNSELDNVKKILSSLNEIIAPKGRAAFITFHSIEDRLVKFAFKEMAQSGNWRLVHKKPLFPSDEEVKSNPRARSAKLRVIEKI